MTATDGLVLALETSTRRPSVAARYAGATRVAHLDGERAHASDLLPALDGLVRELDAPRAALVRVVVGLGPGSLTGMRVGAATARGLVSASGAELVGVASFEAAVLDASARTADGEPVLVLNDARGGRFDLAVYAASTTEPGLLEAPHSVTVEEAETRAAAFDGALVLADAGTLERFSFAPTVTTERLAPAAHRVLELGLGRAAASDPAQVEPLYLREWEARTRAKR